MENQRLKKGLIGLSFVGALLLGGHIVTHAHENGINKGQAGTGTLAWYYCTSTNSKGPQDNMIGYQHVQPGEDAEISGIDPQKLDADSRDKYTYLLRKVNDSNERDKKIRVISLTEFDSNARKRTLAMGYFPRGEWKDPNKLDLTSIRNELVKKGCNDGLTDIERE